MHSNARVKWLRADRQYSLRFEKRDNDNQHKSAQLSGSLRQQLLGKHKTQEPSQPESSSDDSDETYNDDDNTSDEDEDDDSSDTEKNSDVTQSTK